MPGARDQDGDASTDASAAASLCDSDQELSALAGSSKDHAKPAVAFGSLAINQQAEAGKQTLPDCVTFLLTASFPTHGLTDCVHRNAYQSKQA